MRTEKSLKPALLALCLAVACGGALAQAGSDVLAQAGDDALAQAGGGTPARHVTGAGKPAQTGAGSPYDEQAGALLARPDIRAAFADVEKNRDSILREWIALTEINAPSGKEAERAAFIERLLRGYKSVDVRRDSAGNIVATRRGAGGGPTVVIDAHMDTVFQEGLKIKVEMRDGKIYAPGVGDDTRNV
ncbi:MAG: tripeptide aminopeptidase, partial [Acidobacteriota bacterium]|nr:tripeptide aminopeptidase [Acidobacteriota bacterium]